LIFLVENV